MTDLKKDIQQALAAFNTQDTYTAAMNFWKTLGYESDKQPIHYEFSFDDLRKNISSKVNPERLKSNEWNEFSYLFQVTSDELKSYFVGQDQTEIPLNNPKTDIEKGQKKSYLFSCLKLSSDKYSRSILSDITRYVNKHYMIPTILLISHGKYVSIAVSERRESKVDSNRDVIGKVTIIKDIDTENPHPAHLAILAELSISNLSQKAKSLSSFDELHRAWSSVLDIKKLNKDFYDKITAWYRNALQIIQIPFTNELPSKEKEETTKNFLVKMLCRLMFCWFLKEKGLIDRRLLELSDYSGNNYDLLSDNAEESSNSYYRGILRPLFFECLNEPLKNRIFTNVGFISYLARSFDLRVFKNIPYLNGGIFDRDDEFFNDNFILDDNVSDIMLSIPNKLFYGCKDFAGINQIFNKYKFTIEESTPLDAEVALDPELLGMVFENLLAELDPDPDISKNARKNSGSYYTPREVIEFMVNDALVLYLENKAKEQNHPEYSEQIRFLVYLDTKNNDTPEFDDFIVRALDKIKILDPACGSGAFPMGMLHKISTLLSLVDQDNSKWLNLKLKGVDENYKAEFKKNLKQHYDGYSRKLGILRDSIYGLDIQPLAAHIAKLRFFISLIVDQKTGAEKQNFGVTPLPNLETNILCVNSLNDQQPLIFDNDLKKYMLELTQAYYKNDQDHDAKNRIADEIAAKLAESYSDFHWISRDESVERKKEYWKRWFKFGNIACPFFHMEAFFPSVDAHGGFDIVMGNPPYGGMKIDDKLRNLLCIESKDPYGAFIAKFLRFKHTGTILKPGGILSYIVSDTFMTIKSHRPLRTMMLDNYIHKMIRMHPDTFKQVVNTVVFLCQKTPEGFKIPDEHQCLMVDMTNISIHKNYDKFQNIMYSIEDISKVKRHSDKVYAIFKYKQNVIQKCSLKPLFVAPEKFFAFVQDNGVERDEEDKTIRYIHINGKKVGVRKLGDIALVTVGLQTGDNPSYLYQIPESGSKYRDITPFKHLVITDKELDFISANNLIRQKITNHGFHITKDEHDFDPERWFEGRYIVPYDKGAAADTDSGWLPNYYVPAYYYIDWSSWAVNRIKTLTIGERERNANTSICSRFQNTDTYFKKGISFSITGIYAPTFRLNGKAVYDVKSSLISFGVDQSDVAYLLGILCSKLIKMISKAYIYHTVDMQVNAIKEIPLPILTNASITCLVEQILDDRITRKAICDYKQIQKEIDMIVMQLFGLDNNDIKEVEDWYARRYPRLTGYELLDN